MGSSAVQSQYDYSVIVPVLVTGYCISNGSMAIRTGTEAEREVS